MRNPRPASLLSAFTLVEVMIVVVIIGLLAAIATQTFAQISRASRATVLGNDFRQYRDAFHTYAMAEGEWPEQAAPGVVPIGMEDALRGFDSPAMQGQWQWRNNPDDGVAVCLVNPSVEQAVMQDVDSMLDDGSLATGMFKAVTPTIFVLRLHH